MALQFVVVVVLLRLTFLWWLWFVVLSNVVSAVVVYHAGKNDYQPFFFFECLITEFGNNYRNRFFSLGAYF